MRTLFRDVEVDTGLASVDGADDPTRFCTNDRCPGLEVVEHGGEVVEVIRLAWDSRYVGSSGPSYGCGGEPAYEQRPECPECGASGEPLP